MNLMQDPVSGLMLPRQFIDEKQALKKVIDDLVERAVMANQHIRGRYFLVLHAKFDKLDPSKFVISRPIITKKYPPLITNQMVFYLDNELGIKELLWMVSRDRRGKPKVEYNTKGVAYLSADKLLKKPS